MDLAEVIRQHESQGRGRRRRGRVRRIRPSGSAASDIVRLTRELQSLNVGTQRALSAQLFPLLRRRQTEYLRDALIVEDDFADDLRAVLDRIRLEHVLLAEQRAEVLASAMVSRINRRNRQRFYRSIEEVVGIDVSRLVSEAGLTQVIKLKAAENVSLIKTIPAQHFDRIESLVFESVIQGRTPARSLIEEIREIGDVSKRRARFIARDQTSKLTAALNRERNLALGITEYIWRTSRDEAVRPSHRRKHGKRYRFDDPPQDTGHPGEDYNCRCVAEPVIDL